MMSLVHAGQIVVYEVTGMVPANAEAVVLAGL